MMQDDARCCKMMQDDDDDDDDNDDPMILNIKNHTSERTIVPWTVIFDITQILISFRKHSRRCTKAMDH